MTATLEAKQAATKEAVEVLAEDHAQMDTLHESLVIAWALDRDPIEGTPQLIYVFLRAAYGRGYTAALEHHPERCPPSDSDGTVPFRE